jgi:hypothetical protein
MGVSPAPDGDIDMEMDMDVDMDIDVLLQFYVTELTTRCATQRNHTQTRELGILGAVAANLIAIILLWKDIVWTLEVKKTLCGIIYAWAMIVRAGTHIYM